jgi:hypothetical protein
MTSVDIENSTQSKLCKAVPEFVRYDPFAQKLFFKDVVEIFQQIPNLATSILGDSIHEIPSKIA